MASVPTPPHYDKAPIAEASITVGIEPIPAQRYPLLGTLALRLGNDYPHHETLSEAAKKVSESPGSPGIVYSDADRKRIIRARADGVTFSRLAPYDRWETFLPEARRSWELYKETLGDVKATRGAVRYINSIVIPLGLPLRDLFNTYPLLPDSEQLLDSMFMRYDYRLITATEFKIAVLMYFQGPLADDHGRMLLDNTVSFDAVNETQLWGQMATARTIKNDLFESQITSRLKESFRDAYANPG
jgi:uncharacterized protein (TIGR04255 family)